MVVCRESQTLSVEDLKKLLYLLKTYVRFGFREGVLGVFYSTEDFLKDIF